jgi:hypothetical protein
MQKTSIISDFHLAALGCVSIRNPKIRRKEREILRKAAWGRGTDAQIESRKRRRGFCDENEEKAIGKQT